MLHDPMYAAAHEHANAGLVTTRRRLGRNSNIKRCLRPLIALTLAFLLATPLLAQESRQALEVSVARANVRSAASMTGEVIVVVSQGDALRVISKSGEWYFVETPNGRRGYIHTNVVKAVPTQRLANDPPVAPTAESNAADDSPLGNDDVIAMTRAQIAADLIIASIRQADSTDFDLSPSGLIDLTNAGVSEAVIRLMIDHTEAANDTPPVEAFVDVAEVSVAESVSSPAASQTPAAPMQPADNGRSISLGAKGGWTYTDSRGEIGDVIEFDAAQGFAVGVVVASEFHPNVDLQAEGLFVRKKFSAKLSAAFVAADLGIKLDYFEVPVLAVLHGRRDGGATPFAIVGLAFSFLAGAEGEFKFEGIEETEDIKDQITSVDIGIVFGGGVELPQDWGTITVDGRYTLGLRNLGEESGDEDIKVGSFAIMGGIVFD